MLKRVLLAESCSFFKAITCYFFLDKKVTKKSRQNDIQPVLPAAILGNCSLVASTFYLYSLMQTVYFIEVSFINIKVGK